MATDESAPHDAVVLAGGAGRRLGGADKSRLRVGGRTLLDHVLAACAAARSVVVVGDVVVPEGIDRTVEDPPGSGPVAGLAAGLAALAAPPAPWTLVLAVDQPGAAGVVPELLTLLPDVAADVDGVCPADGRGRVQWLLAAYRTASLRRALAELGDPRGRSVRDLVAPLMLQPLDLAGSHAGDVDTWADLREWERRLGG